MTAPAIPLRTRPKDRLFLCHAHEFLGSDNGTYGPDDLGDDHLFPSVAPRSRPSEVGYPDAIPEIFDVRDAIAVNIRDGHRFDQIVRHEWLRSSMAVAWCRDHGLSKNDKPSQDLVPFRDTQGSNPFNSGVAAGRASTYHGEVGPRVTLGSRDAGASSRGGVESRHAVENGGANFALFRFESGSAMLNRLTAGVASGPRETKAVVGVLARKRRGIGRTLSWLTPSTKRASEKVGGL